MYPRGAFLPVPPPLPTSYTVRAPTRIPLPSFTASEPALRRRSVRRRARVRLVPYAVAEPPPAISSPTVEQVPPVNLPATGKARNGGSDREDAGDSSEADSSAGEEETVFRVGMPHTNETRKKISAANKGKVPWNKGRKHSEETKRKIAEATRRAMSHPETRARLKNVATGRKHTPATKRKIASACVRSRAVRAGPLGDGSDLSEGERPIVLGSAVYRAKRRTHVPFDWGSETVITINQRIHNRATEDDFKGLGEHRVGDGERTRRPMSAATRAKLSARIKELWADPEYRERVSSGVKRVCRERGSQRPPLSEAHRENIRQSLLRRNACLRGEGVPAPRPRQKHGRRDLSKGRADLVGTKLAGQAISDDYGQFLASREKEEAALDAKHLKDEGLKKRQKLRSAKKIEKQEEEAARSAAKQRAQDGLLLEALAAAGQLPPLNDKDDATLVSGLPANYPDVFGSGGMLEAGAGGLFEAVNESSNTDNKGTLKASRLVFSSGNGSVTANGHADGAVGDDVIATNNSALLDFDIYASPKSVADLESDGDAAENDSDSEDGKISSHSHSIRSIGSIPALSDKTDVTDGLFSSKSRDETLPLGGCDDVELESEEDVESLLAEVARAESAASSSFVAADTESAADGDEAEEDVWFDASSPDGIAIDGTDASGVVTVSAESLDGVVHGHGGDTRDCSGLSMKVAAAETRESVTLVNEPNGNDRKRVVTYVNGVAEFRFVD